MPQVIPAVAAWWGALGTGTQVALGATAASVAGAGISSALAPGAPHIGLPPPPGAAMIDQSGAQAAGDLRRRQAAAGGLQSTVGAGATPQAAAGYNSATAGAKTMLGQ